MPIETEIKARLRDRAALRARLEEAGARLEQPRGLEDNVLLDAAEALLRGRGENLRLRRAGGRCLLTWKGPRRVEAAVRSREELETEVGDGATLERILAALGFRPTFRYQKYRETWTLEGVQVLIDETPAGDFVEIEGAREALLEVARRLDIPPAEWLPESYPALLGRWLAEGGLGPDALLFPEGRDPRG